MGRRPRADEAASNLNVRLTPAERANLEILAERWGLESKGEAVRRALEVAARYCWACGGDGLRSDGGEGCVQCEGSGLAPVERE